jgi:uncharacterized protein DUF998
MSALGSMWPPELAFRKMVLLLRPAGWPLVPPELRPRLRALAIAALAAQAVLVAAWLVAGSLESGYDAADQTVSELASVTADHSWIVRAAFVAWGLGFVALGAGTAITLRGRPWSRVTPALFVGCGICVAALGMLQLDCAATVNDVCDARQDAGLLSWHNYAHHWVGLAFELLLLATPFALARAEWPHLIGKLTLLCGVTGIAIFAATWAGFSREDAPFGVYERLGLGVVHVWVVLVAGGLLVEASSRWPSRTAAEGPLAYFRGAQRMRGGGAA